MEKAASSSSDGSAAAAIAASQRAWEIYRDAECRNVVGRSGGSGQAWSGCLAVSPKRPASGYENSTRRFIKGSAAPRRHFCVQARLRAVRKSGRCYCRHGTSGRGWLLLVPQWNRTYAPSMLIHGRGCEHLRPAASLHVTRVDCPCQMISTRSPSSWIGSMHAGGAISRPLLDLYAAEASLECRCDGGNVSEGRARPGILLGTAARGFCAQRLRAGGNPADAGRGSARLHEP